eukprot:14795151-Heterocapsa_arctica.AAC.1
MWCLKCYLIHLADALLVSTKVGAKHFPSGIGMTITPKAEVYWHGPAPPYVSIRGQRQEQHKDLVALVAGQAAA